MMYSRVAPLVSVKWLAEAISRRASPVRVLDGSYHLSPTRRPSREDYLERHIPGAQYFDILECRDKSSEYKCMLSSSEQFASYVGALGINNSSHVVVYDDNETHGILSAARLWWMFHVFGHPQVSVLDGGLQQWMKEGQPVTDVVDSVKTEVFKAAPKNLDLVKSFEEMEKNVDEKAFQVMDARGKARFDGTADEPAAAILPGHMPNSVNIPYTAMMDPETKTFKSPDLIKKIFQEKGIDLDKPLVATCGSGISACVIAMGAYLCGKEDVPIYNGSWSEWFKRAKPEHKINVPKRPQGSI